MIAEKVKKFIDKYKLTGTFIVAFSGGYDSMCLLDILNKLKYDLVAVHLNHNWRGEESLKEAEYCKIFTQAKNIKFYSETLSDDVKKTETSAREERYKFFYRCAKIFNSNIVFTAHNFEDNAETVIYRIIKGTGTIGLRGIEEHRDIFYRPLLKISRDDIEKYCKENNLKPNNDSSNKNTKYKRNLIRKKIIPLMKEINPDVINSINSLSEIAKEDFENKNSENYFIRDLLIEHHIDYDRKKIEDIKQFINENKKSKSGKMYSLTKDLWLYASEKSVEVISKSKKSNEEIKILNEGEYEFEDWTFSIKKWVGDCINFPKDDEFKALINIDKIDFTLRHRKNGDIIKPLGCNGTQKLKKYLNEKKIPQHQKDKLILLCNYKEVLWTAGVGLSDIIKVQTEPTHVIELRRNHDKRS